MRHYERPHAFDRNWCGSGCVLHESCAEFFRQTLLELRFGLELVAHAVARLDERVPRCLAVDLVAQLAHEDVDGAVAVPLAPAPQLLEQLVPADDAAPL